MRIIAGLLILWPACAVSAAPVAGQAGPVIAIDGVRPMGGDLLIVRLLLMNGDETRVATPPARLDAMFHAAGRDAPVSLLPRERGGVIPPHGWIAADYMVKRPEGMTGDAVLSLGAGREGYAFALAAPSPEPGEAPSRVAQAAPVTAQISPVAGRSVLANLTAYEPTYAAAGGGTDSDLKVQLSFKYQLFGQAGAPEASWLDGLHLAYTQKIFWDVTADSQPFRDVSYQPELIWIHNWAPRSNGVRFGVRGGFLHESNGKGGDDSRGYQYLYVQPQAELPLGDYTLSVGPRLFHYVFGRDNNPDIARYRGHQALEVSIGREDGLMLSTTSRFNISHGKGAVDGEISYPLRNVLGGTPLYLVVQGFTGYGEDLLDYNRHQTRVRVGLGITR
ncbi:phospholipase A [Sphingomonas oligoaromativorans]|uniref:phospholipase A n=1 Tax=Sphingomonas oligoaromativorans TaxID=575322 RepID=UPI00141E2B04|nr:phospholipase A [Sphingomonas oligoaromativorans]NIJ31749.1 outer membrane phospholipase A [Sphingomonas oligoaromativorans]